MSIYQFMRSNVFCISLTYNNKGHSRDYIDCFIKNIYSKVPVTLFCYGKPSIVGNLSDYEYCEGDPKYLDYCSDQKFSTYRKILRRVITSSRFYKKLYKLISGDTNKKLLFVDYEYLSLIIFLSFFLRKNPKIIVLHSVSESEISVKRIYKSISYFIMEKIPNVSYIVNGEYSAKLLRKRTSKEVVVIQYPTSLKYPIIPKSEAKAELGLGGRTVIAMIGMIRKDKNYHEAILSFSRSKMANNKSYVLLIAGYPSNITAGAIEELFKNLGLSNYIFCPGYLSELSLHTHFCAADFLLAPYGSKGSSQSGPVSQARLYELPVITLSGGEIGGYVEREKVGITFDGLGELKCVLDNLILSEPYYDFSSVKYKFSWENAAKIYSDILK